MVARIIRHLMVDTNTTTIELAKMVGVSRQTISNIINGKHSTPEMERKILNTIVSRIVS